MAIRSEAQAMFEKELRDKANYKKVVDMVARLNPDVMNRKHWQDIINLSKATLALEKG